VTNQHSASSIQAKIIRLIRKPRHLLYLLAAWSLLAGVTQLFVNSSFFVDVHNAELDGALGGFALSFNAIPLALLYLYCSRDPQRYYHIFWLSLVHQAAMAAGNLYHLAIGTFSVESIIIPLTGAVVLAVLSFLQVFEPRPASRSIPPQAEIGTQSPSAS
jgi:hypothetical protein